MSKKHKKEKEKKKKEKKKKKSKAIDDEKVKNDDTSHQNEAEMEKKEVAINIHSPEQQLPTQQKQQPTLSFSWEAAFAQASNIKPAEGLEEDNDFFVSQPQQQQQGEKSGVAKVAELVNSCHKNKNAEKEDIIITETSKPEEQNDNEEKKKEKKVKKKKKKREKDEEHEDEKDASLEKSIIKEDQSDQKDDSKDKTKKEKKKKKRNREEQENDTIEHHDNKKAKKQKKEKKKKKKSEKKDDEKEERDNDKEGEKEETSLSPSSTPPPLEGRMVPLPLPFTEMIMVLIDKKKNVVYTTPPAAASSSDGDDDEEGDKDEDNKMVAVGTLNEKNEVILKEEKLYWLDSNNEKKENSKSTAATSDSISPSFPYEVEPDDHCETPLESYEDIVPLLQKLKSSTFMEHSDNDIAIYDPYYCDGSVISNLSKLGFPNVYNKKEDCYAVWKTGVGYPYFDTLITNPPYSGDHIQKLIQHITSPQFGYRAWFLLLPKFVHKKDYYKKALYSADIRPFYLVPKKRYVYVPPKNFRDKKASDVHKKSSPFVSMWYIWGGCADSTRMLADYYYQRSRNVNGGSDTSFSRCDVARSKSELRDLRRQSR